MQTRRIARWVGIVAVALLGLSALTVAGAVVVLQGKRLVWVANKLIPPMRGKIEVKAVYWKTRALVDLLTDRPTPVVVEGLKITDPEGTVVMQVPHLEVKVRARSAIAGRIYLHDLKIGPGSTWRFAAMKKSEDNGFLASFQSLDQPPAPTPPGPGAEPKSTSAYFQIVNADLDGMTAVFDFPAWGLELRNIKSPATLLVDGLFVGWDAQGLDARSGGYLRILTDVLPFERVLVNRVATTREWPDSIFLDVGAARTGRSTLVAKGYFTEIYGYGYKRLPDTGIALHGEFTDAADALAAVAAARAIPGLRVSGRGAKVSIDLQQPFAHLAIAASLSGLDVAFGSYEARGLAVRAKVVTDPLNLALEDLSFSSPGGGRFVLGADLVDTKLKARLKFDRFATASYVPPALRKLAGGKLTGRLAFSADIGADKQVALNQVDLSFARAKGGKVPGSVKITGRATASGQRIATSGIKIEVPGASAELRGEVQLAKQILAFGLRASTSDLPGLFTSAGMQPLARGAALSLEVDGKMTSPRARGEVVLRGIGLAPLPDIPEVTTRFRLEDGTLHVDSLSSEAFGGSFQGQGELEIYKHTINKMLRSPALHFRLEGRDVELATLAGLGWASGKVSFVATAEGPLDKLKAHVELPAGATLHLFGSPWELRGIDIEADALGVVVRTAKLQRPGGAQIALEGHMAFAGPMEWRVIVRDVALEGLPGVATAGVPITGRLTADLTATGTLLRPMLSGVIALGAVNVRGTKLGDAKIAIAPLGDSGVKVRGNLFGRFDLDATATYGSAGPRVTAAVSFQRLKLHELLPELVALGDGNGTATGKLTVDFRPDAPLVVDARLQELQVYITRQTTDKNGKTLPQRIWVHNAGDLHAVMTGDRVVLDEWRMVTDGGEFRLQGELAGNSLRGAFTGHLSLDLLQPFLRQQVDRLSGDVAVDLKVSGTTARPVLEGTLGIAHPVHLQPVGATPEITIPSGTIKLAANSVQLAGLAVTIDEATLTLAGLARYDDKFALTAVELDAGGEVSASLLETLASSAVSDASGRAKIKAHIGGTLAAPVVTGRIDLGEIELRLRDLGRQITVESGVVELTSRELILRDVKTRIDEQGRLFIGSGGKPGRVALKSLYPKLETGYIELPLKGERLTYRVPNVMEVDDVGFTLALTGDLQQGLALRGQVLVMSGRYVQDFNVQKMVISPRIRERSARNFYDDNPLLEELELDLRVSTVGDTFIVQNNLAPEIHVWMDLRVSGTLSDPRLAGNVRPTDGRFHILGMRGDFELVPNVNHITFVETKSVADLETPELNLEAQNLVTDSTGAEHNVRMRIHGPIGQAAIELSSDDGLDRNQTLLLLVSGRINDDPTRLGTTQNPTLGSNLRTGTDMVGQISRDTVANLVEPYIDDTLQLLTGRKINLRPTVGADGFELKLGARASRQLDVQLSFLRGFQNQQRYRGELSLWVRDYVNARGFYERIILSPQQGLSEDISSFNMELTLDFPLRLWRP